MTPMTKRDANLRKLLRNKCAAFDRKRIKPSLKTGRTGKFANSRHFRSWRQQGRRHCRRDFYICRLLSGGSFQQIQIKLKSRQHVFATQFCREIRHDLDAAVGAVVRIFVWKNQRDICPFKITCRPQLPDLYETDQSNFCPAPYSLCIFFSLFHQSPIPDPQSHFN